MLHYYAKEFFSPVIITSRLTKGNEIFIYVVSDLLSKLVDLNVEIIIYEWKSAKSVNTTKISNVTIVSYICTFSE